MFFIFSLDSWEKPLLLPDLSSGLESLYNYLNTLTLLQEIAFVHVIFFLIILISVLKYF